MFAKNMIMAVTRYKNPNYNKAKQEFFKQFKGG